MSTADTGSTRDGLVEQVLMGGRRLSTAAVLFHAALADLRGLGATDEKALDLVDRFGPLTPGELSQRSGLAPATVTDLVGRLEDRGAVRRIPHPQDGRKMLVEMVPQFATDNLSLYDELVRLMRDLCADYDDAQLATIVGFLEEAAERQMVATRSLAQERTSR